MVAATCLAACLAACTQPVRSFEPDRNADQLDDVGFLHYLPTVPVVTVAEGSRAVLMLLEPHENRTTHDARWNELLRRGAVKDPWNLRPEQIMDMGTLAHMLCVICAAPPSINQRIAAAGGFGDRRYALHTAAHEGLLPYARAHAPVTGGELLSALQRAEQYRQSDTGSRAQVP